MFFLIVLVLVDYNNPDQDSDIFLKDNKIKTWERIIILALKLKLFYNTTMYSIYATFLTKSLQDNFYSHGSLAVVNFGPCREQKSFGLVSITPHPHQTRVQSISP